MTETTIGDHALHFYEDDTGLATTVATFLGPGFAGADAVISIGTRAHLSAIEQRLRSDGYDVDAARREGRYVSMDAERIIARLLRNGLPTRETFGDVVGQHIERLAETHHNVRAFGEIVSLLWRDGKRHAALRLEELWNESLGYHPLSLICGYAARIVADETGAEPATIVTAHTRIIRSDA